MKQTLATAAIGCLPREESVLVLSPVSRDAQDCCQVLAREGFVCVVCCNMTDFCTALREGAGVAFLAEEDFILGKHEPLLRWLHNQPSWSDFPFLFLSRGDADSPVTRRALNLLGNVILLERPPKSAALISAAHAALRARRRQYQIRALQESLHRSRMEAEKMRRAKKEFVSDMNHEIRTPLTVILSALELSAQAASETERQELLEMAHLSADRLLHLIDNVLEASQDSTPPRSKEIVP